MREGEKRYDAVQYPSKKELALEYSDDELRERDPQWVAGYFFDKMQTRMYAGIRVQDIFPGLAEEKVNDLTLRAADWWIHLK